MPAFLAPLVGFALGALLAWIRTAAPKPPAAHARPASPDPALVAAERRPLAVAALFGALVFAPICAYFLLFAPDWSLAYLLDSRRVPSAIDLLLVLVDAASPPAGFIAFERLSTRRSQGTLASLAALIAVPLAIAALATLLLARSLSVDGTYRQVHGDFGVRPVAGGPLGYALLWMNGLLIAGFALAARAVLTAGRPSPGIPLAAGLLSAPRPVGGPGQTAAPRATPPRPNAPPGAGARSARGPEPRLGRGAGGVRGRGRGAD